MNRRILIVDDDAAIHSALTNILREFSTSSTYEGPAALAAVEAAVGTGTPFALAFIDVEMPGWGGLETLERLWRVDPHIQAVICTGTALRAEVVHQRFPDADGLLVIKKPFSVVEIAQAAQALTCKWTLQQGALRHVEELESAVAVRTQQLADELAWRDRAEAEQRLSQRLEAVGQLAAGIAHEINNPIQYMGDNLAFLSEVIDELLAATPDVDQYIRAELPRSVSSIRGGLDRISGIVRAMKQLSRSGTRAAAPADINAALEDALCVSASSYRSIADVDRTFATLPPVTCYIAELGQVFLNLIINAAHAMEGRGRGTLGITTTLDGEHVVIAISDTGCGIPPEIRDRIFDPFFSTKEVGKGTGQGLTISRSIVVDRHAGTLELETAVGIGTTFRIRIPIVQVGRSSAASEAAGAASSC